VDLSLEMFQQVQQLIGREFTKLVASEGVLRSSDFHSLDEMPFHDLSDHHSWLNAGIAELRSCLLHYQDCKGSGFLYNLGLHIGTEAQTWICEYYITSMDSDIEIPNGQLIHVWQGGNLYKEKTKYAMQVLYDPVQSEQLHHISQDGRVTMQFVGKAAGTEVHRKKPRLPYPCRKVPTAVHTIGTAHAAPEVPELFMRKPEAAGR
jgi:hypothetical protein